MLESLCVVLALGVDPVAGYVEYLVSVGEVDETEADRRKAEDKGCNARVGNRYNRLSACKIDSSSG